MITLETTLGYNIHLLTTSEIIVGAFAIALLFAFYVWCIMYVYYNKFKKFAEDYNEEYDDFISEREISKKRFGL